MWWAGRIFSINNTHVARLNIRLVDGVILALKPCIWGLEPIDEDQFEFAIPNAMGV